MGSAAGGGKDGYTFSNPGLTNGNKIHVPAIFVQSKEIAINNRRKESGMMGGGRLRFGQNSPSRWPIHWKKVNFREKIARIQTGRVHDPASHAGAGGNHPLFPEKPDRQRKPFRPPPFRCRRFRSQNLFLKQIQILTRKHRPVQRTRAGKSLGVPGRAALRSNRKNKAGRPAQKEKLALFLLAEGLDSIDFANPSPMAATPETLPHES